MEDNTVAEKTEVKRVEKNYPYALFSLFLGILSFIQLLGLERALAAVGFGIIALLGIKRNGNVKERKYAYWGIALGIIYMMILLAIILYQRGDILCILNRN
ncbi:MAG: hypothetical protein FP827_04880 [Candidatus Omnitrophica bacterium]|nr:hypothetical protein [Candidatus Omnitrophota bacterium]